MRGIILGLVAVAALALAACHRAGTNQSSASAGGAAAIAWREGDVDDAFAEAKESGKPVMLYWGAKWCPPCNAMKTTLFKDAAFVAQTRAFVPVYLDGDSKGAQGWGERFQITGYPTVIILRADRSEVTRLANGTAPARLAEVLRATAARTTSSDQLLQTALRDPARLSADDWKLLGSYEWFNDPRHFGDPQTAQPTLRKLAAAAPDPALARRFAFNALSTRLFGDKVALGPAEMAEVRTMLPAIMAHPDEVRANEQMLGFAGPKLVSALPDAAERQRLGDQLIGALDRIYADPTLPIGDRFAAVDGDVALAKARNAGKVPAAVLAKVRARAAWADAHATDAMTRQATLPSVAEVLDEAGDPAAATKLLEANLGTAVAPAYYMSILAGIAEERKDKAAAVDWSRRAFEAAHGPATRVQWAIDYSDTVVRLRPADSAAVERSAAAVVDALGDDTGGYFQRTRHKMQAWGGRLRKWSVAYAGGPVLQRIEGRMDAVCAKKGSARANCLGWMEKA